MSKKISLKIRMLANELNRKTAEFLKEDGDPSSAVQMRILNFIHRNNREKVSVYQKDIEREFDIRRSTATGILQRLEKRHLIERKSCKDDNRLKAIFLTEHGKQKVKENICKLQRFDRELIEDISEEELTIFFKILEMLSEKSKQIEMNEESGEEG